MLIRASHPDVHRSFDEDPSIAEMKVTHVQVKNKPVRLETQLDENIGVVTGNLSEDFFYVGLLDDVVILGKVDIFVQQGNKRAGEKRLCVLIHYLSQYIIYAIH